MFIRPITDSDLPAVLEVYRQCEDFLALGPDPHASLEMVAKDRQLSAQEGGIYCGIFHENTTLNLTGSRIMVGILDYTPNYLGEPDAAFIELLMVAAPYRGRGLGEQAVRWLVSALESGAGQIRLYAAVQVNNPAAIRFWQRMGFRITSPAALQPDSTTTYPIEAIYKRKT